MNKFIGKKITLVIGVLLLSYHCSGSTSDSGLQNNNVANPVDNELPGLTSVPDSGQTLGNIPEFTIIFSEAVLKADQLSSYNIIGTSGGLLTLSKITTISPRVYRLTLDGLTVSGTLSIRLNDITDLAGNAMVTNQLNFIIDTDSPTQFASPISGSSLSGLSTFDITFSELMPTALSAVHYSLSGTALGSLSINNISSLGSNSYRLTLSGTPTGGTLTISISNLKDSGGNNLVGTVINYSIDLSPPLLSVLPSKSSVLNSIASIDLTYSEPTTGIDNPANYSLTGSAIGTLSISSIVNLGGNLRRLLLAGTGQNGELNITVSGAQDSVGNNLLNPSFSYSIDTINPTVTSLPATGSNISTLNPITLVFSEPVNGANQQSNYSITGVGAGTLAIASVTTVSANQYLLNTSGSLGTGNVQLNISNVTDLVSLNLTGGSLSFSADVTAPTLVTTPASGSIVTALSQIDIAFSEVVSGALNTANYKLSGSALGTLTIANVSNLGGNNYRLTLSGTSVDGSLTISITNIKDSAGNQLVGNFSAIGIDSTAPGQTTLPPNGSTIGLLSSIDILYSENTIGSDTLTNYSLSGTGVGTLTVQSIQSIGAHDKRLMLNGAATTGSLLLTISNVTDSRTLSLANTTTNYNVDTSNPTVTSTPANGSTINSMNNLILQYSEPVVNANITGNYVISGNGQGSINLISINTIGSNRYQLNFTGSLATGLLNINIFNISDVSMNALAGNSLALIADMTAPAITATNPAQGSITNSLTQVEFTFSEPVTGATTSANYNLSGSGQGTLAVQSATLISGNTYRVIFSGAATSGLVSLSVTGVTDLTGNTIAANNSTYTVDLINPTFTSSPTTGTSVAALPQIDITFSEAVTGAGTLTNYTLSGAGKGTLTLSTVNLISGSTYRLTLTGSPVDGIITIALNNINDLATNSLSGSPLNYIGDTLAPTVISQFPSSGATSMGRDVPVQIIFSENILASSVNASSFKVNDGSSDVAGVITTVENHIYFMPTSLLPSSQLITVTATTAVTDLVGNSLASDYSFTFTTRTTESFYLVKDIFSGGSSSQIKYMTVFNGNVFFSAWGTSGKNEPWRSNGTSGGTGMLANINPSFSSDPEFFTVSNGFLFFSANNGTKGFELWRTTGSGANLVADIHLSSSSYPEGLTNVNNTLFFSAFSGSASDLYKSTGSGASVVAPTCLGGLCGGTSNMTEMGGFLYFTVSNNSNGNNGQELWKSDGTNGGTFLLKDILAGSSSSSPQNLKAIGSLLYFNANDGVNGRELWQSDGTNSGTVLVKDINTGTGDSTPANFISAAGTIFFTASDGTNGVELWKTDGTTAGTVLVKDINSGVADSNINTMIAAFGKLYFEADDGTNGTALWQSDGTAAGTISILKMNIFSMTVMAGSLYIQASTANFGTELWLSDGSASGTFILADIYPGAVNGILSKPVELSGKLLMSARDDNGTGSELWRYDP